MPACLLNKCCCCIDLRIGCFIIGYFMLFSKIIELVVHISTLFTKKNAVAGVVVQIVVCIIAIAFSIVLVYGLHKNKPGYVKIYLLFCCASVLLFLIGVISVSVVSFEVDVLIGSLITLLIMIYFMMVIRSYYYRMLEEASHASPASPVQFATGSPGATAPLGAKAPPEAKAPPVAKAPLEAKASPGAKAPPIAPNKN